MAVICKCFGANTARVKSELVKIHKAAVESGNPGDDVKLGTSEEDLRKLRIICADGNPDGCDHCFPLLKEEIEEFNKNPQPAL